MMNVSARAVRAHRKIARRAEIPLFNEERKQNRAVDVEQSRVVESDVG